MSLTLRRFAPVLFIACAALLTAGCGSNNKGKIVGKWKISDFGGDKVDDKMKELGDKISIYMEFRADETGGFGVDVNDPVLKKAFEANKDKTTFSFKYKLLNGDVVEVYDLPKEMQENGPFGKKDRGKMRVKIDGDNMTISDDETLKNKPAKLTRMK